MSDQTKTLTFHDTAPSLSQVIAELTAALETMESGETLRIVLPSLRDEQFPKWRYAILALCKQWNALVADGNVTHYQIEREDGRHACLYEADFVIQK
jgi:hypothetical protein